MPTSADSDRDQHAASVLPARPTKVDAVFRDLLQDITQRRLKPDDALPPERDLADRFGVSRRVVREALGRLKGLGVLDARRKRGTQLAECTWRNSLAAQIPCLAASVDSLLQLYDLRMALECGNALQVVTSITDEQVDELRTKVEQMTQCRTMAELAPVECDFHIRLLTISGNPLMEDLGGVIVEFFQLNVEKGPGRYMTPRPEVSLKRHMPIVEWLATRDPAGLWDAFREHLERRVDLHRDSKSVSR